MNCPTCKNPTQDTHPICEWCGKALNNYSDANQFISDKDYTMRIYRKAKYSLSANPIEIFIDGNPITCVHNGYTVEISITEGKHHVSAICRTRKKEFYIDVNKDITIELRFAGFFDTLEYTQY